MVSFALLLKPSTIPDDKTEWTQAQLDAMVDAASCVFAAALDGGGYLVWEL